MTNRGLPKRRIHERQSKHPWKRSLLRLLALAGISLGAIVLVGAVSVFVFGDAILNGYGKGKMERAFARAHPGYAVRIGELDYSIWANRMVAHSASLVASNTTIKVGRISMTGVSWVRLLLGTADLPDTLTRTSLDATNLDVEFAQAHYGIRIARLRASVSASDLIGEGMELLPLMGDEAFFATDEFRTTRYHVVVPECQVSGLAYGDLLRGQSYRATSIHFTRPAFDALVNRDKPPPPFVKSPPMVHEALMAIRQPLRVDSVIITNGHVSYCERMAVGADPGVLTFSAVNLSAEGIANHGEASAAIQLRGQGDFMNAGVIKLLMSIPITPPDFSLHYSGSLSAMDLARLDAFLDIAESTRIKSGRAKEVSFEIDVTDGEARGRVRAIYENLKIAVLDEQTGTETGFKNRVASFVANALSVHNANVPNAAGSMYEGKVNYTRKPEDKFLPFVWLALRTGIMDTINH